MSSEGARPSQPAAETEDVPGCDYRPSVKLTLRDELSLLDHCLDEARARPRPPSFATGPSLPVVVQRTLGQVSAQVAVVSRRPGEQVNGHQLSGQRVNGGQLAAEESPHPHQLVAEEGGPGGQERSEDGHQVNGHRITAHNLLDLDDEVVVDRKRLLAAIICILQEEINRSR
jgi:hypothetical protein